MTETETNTVVRTPDARFDGLTDYPFAAHYTDVHDAQLGSLRVHYVDEGPRTGRPVLLLHGEPSWSYLYRHFIPGLAQAGFRVLAPDLVGFGKSDKPTRQDDYTYARHVDWMTQWLNGLDLSGITLFCQDWGGLIGLRLLADQPQRFAKLMVANTFLPTGEQEPPEAFLLWREFARSSPDFIISKVLDMGSERALSPAELAAYDAPFPDETYKAGTRAFPNLVPISPDMPGAAENRAAWGVLRALPLPVLTAFSDKDPITRGADALFHKLMPGAAGQAHFTTPNAGHFLQEDQPAMVTERLIAFAGG